MSSLSQFDVIAVLRSHDSSASLRTACTQMNGTKIDVHVGRIQDVTPANSAVSDGGVLLLEVDPQDSDEVEALDQIVHKHFPKSAVVATASEISLPDVRKLMRLGVVDVLPMPINEDDLKTAIKNAGRLNTQESEPKASGGKIISFLKGGGGVGATTMAVQSAHVLASRQKSEEPKVCLLDLDLQFGTVALYLDLETKTDYLDLASAPKRIDQELLASVITRHESGLGVLASPRDVLPLDTLSPEFVSSTLREARKKFSHTLIDLPESWTTWSFSALENSDLIVLVCQMTVAGIRQTRRQLETLKEQGLSELPVQILVNRFEKGWGKTVKVKDAEKSLGQKIDHYILSDYKLVSEAINLGVPLSKIKKGSKVEKAIAGFVDSIDAEVVKESGRVEPRLGL